ncbi:MAG: hypothetical protein KKF78_05070, partial [Candidatus Omnitrophica bacterium]|nr:hypothetical protein [Candidatus Omnitrophota bacterium]
APWGNIHFATYGTGTSATVNNIPLTGANIYVRLWYYDGSWKYTDYTYQTLQTTKITVPSTSTSITDTSVTFEWTVGTGVTNVQLAVATHPSYLTRAPWGNIHFATYGTGTSATVNNIPIGSDIYVRLWYYNGSWKYIDYTYKTAGTPPEIINPTSGTMISTSNVTFEWTKGIGVTNVRLDISTSPSFFNNPHGDIHYETYGTATSAIVNNIPQFGADIYVRLWYYIGSWSYIDYTYQTGG